MCAYRRMSFDASVWTGFVGLFPVFLDLLTTSFLFDLLIAAGIWFLFDRLGSRVLKVFGVEAFGERFICCAVGAGATSLLLLGLGLMRGWRPVVLNFFFYSALIVAGASAYLNRKERAERSSALSLPRWRPGLWEKAACGLMASAFLLGLLGGVVPEIFYDSLVYHLALPQLYLYRGAIVATPENVYSGLPFGLQMLFGWCLSLSGENLAAMLHATFGAASAWALWAWGRRYATGSVGILAALIFYLCPIAMYASWHCGVDLGASFYCVAALYALCRSLESSEEREARGWSITAGLLAGFAMGTKYNVFPLGAVMILVHGGLSFHLGRSLRNTFWMAGAAAVAVLPWLFKNALFYGNPLYPFLYKYLGHAKPIEWEKFMGAAGSRSLSDSFGSWIGFKTLLLTPWRSSFDDLPAGDWPGPVLLFVVPCAFLLYGRYRYEGNSKNENAPRVMSAWVAALILAAAGFAIWALTSRLVRYALPVIPFLALCGALAVEKAGFPRWMRRVAWICIFYACLFNFSVSFRQGKLIGQWKYLHAGRVKSEYLKHQRTTYGLPYYAAMEFIKENTPRDSKILFLGESRAYYCPRDFISGTLYDVNPFWKAVAESRDAGQLHARVRKMGATHIFLSARQMLYRRDSTAAFPRDLIRGRVFNNFWFTYLTRVFEERVDHGADPRWLSVYKIEEAPLESSARVKENPARIVLDFLDRNEKPDGSL